MTPLAPLHCCGSLHSTGPAERRRFFCAHLLLLLSLVLLSGVSLVFFLQNEHGRDDPHNRTIGARWVKGVLVRSKVLDLRICRCAPDEVTTLTRPDGLSTRANLYKGKGTDAALGPALMLQHGNTTLGKDLPTYQVLARALADEGITVLAYDRLGFGESDNPIIESEAKTRLAYSPEPTAEVALKYLKDRPEVDPERISVLGHSAGMMTSVKLAMKDESIRHLVLIGPPRRVREESEGTPEEQPTAEELAANKAYWLKRFNNTYAYVYGRPAPAWFDTSMTELRGPWAMEDYLALFAAPNHIPVLLIDGERESPEDKAYLEAFYEEEMTEPKAFGRLRNTDHYHTSSRALGINIYDKAVVDQLLELLQGFLTLDRPPKM